VTPQSPPGSDAGWDTTEVKALVAGLSDLPDELHREVRKMLRPLGADILRTATWNAAQWSQRIPRALSMQVVLKGSRPGIVIRASLAKAPHARAYEGLVADVFKHRLFGQDVWYTQPARPFILPAIEASYPWLQTEVSNVLATVHRRVGLA